MKRGWLYLSAIVITLVFLAIIGFHFLYSWRVEPLLVENLAIQQTHSRLYREDVDFLSKSILFGKNSARANAGTVLNSRLHWAPTVEGAKVAGAPAPLTNSAVREQFLRMRNDWLRQSSRVNRIKADLSIFSGLEGFDYWDIETMSPIESLSESAKFVPPSQIPIPDTNDLLTAVKIRLMRGAKDGDYLQALQEVRKLSMLLLTTENVQLVIAGLTALDHERRAYRYYVDEKNFSPETWSPIDRNVTRRAHRAVLATRGYLHLWTSPDLLDLNFLNSELPPGFCAAVNEAFPLEYSLRSQLEPRWPLERDFARGYERLDKIINRSKTTCRIRYLSRLIEANEFAGSLPGPIIFNRLPYARKVFGMRLSAISFTGFDAYSQLVSGKIPASGSVSN